MAESHEDLWRVKVDATGCFSEKLLFFVSITHLCYG